MNRLTQLAVTIPDQVDRKDTTGWIAFYVSLIVLLVLFPTGILLENEEYYFQVAARFWSSDEPSALSPIMETSRHLFLSSLAIGLPVHWFGFEAANAILRIAVGLALAFAFARLASVWRLSALDAVMVVAIFMLLNQQYFGGEWIFWGVEGKVFAYILVFLGLAQAFDEKWTSSAFSMIAATWFHFLVGGFWMLASLAWLLLSRPRVPLVLRTLLIYSVGILPLAALIAWQRAEGAGQDPAVDTWYVFAVLRMPHHIAPFSDKWLIWSWTPGIVMLLSTLAASVAALGAQLDSALRRLIWLIIGLQCYLILALLVSATEAGVKLVGQLFVFRPSSLTLLLVVMTLFAVYRRQVSSRYPVWVAAWLVVPAMSWAMVKGKVQDVVATGLAPAELSALVEAVEGTTATSEVVLVQPGRDDERPELSFSRTLPRPTLVNWDFAPTLPASIEEWTRRQQFRVRVFETGCEEEPAYPLGALIVYNRHMPPKPVIDSCGEIVWAGENYSVVDTG